MRFSVRASLLLLSVLSSACAHHVVPAVPPVPQIVIQPSKLAYVNHDRIDLNDDGIAEGIKMTSGRTGFGKLEIMFEDKQDLVFEGVRLVVVADINVDGYDDIILADATDSENRGIVAVMLNRSLRGRGQVIAWHNSSLLLQGKKVGDKLGQQVSVATRGTESGLMIDGIFHALTEFKPVTRP